MNKTLREKIFLSLSRVNARIIVSMVRMYKKIIATIGLPVLRYLGMNTMKNIMLSCDTDVILP